ncbi:flagellar hook-associated protein FlgL [Bacillota bacterium Meth-B3]|nr:flagellar hook-associated protein FlgL [Christensenellaceae bacterium]MEA5065398.1 flagellar hook-associated protein FlgL [Eubacteriales bacterium]MEA5067982.1 flagellar hook-associated protein FlgL [Christensenellaceae bacterium]
MRLTNRMMADNYLKGLSRAMKDLNDLNTKVSSQRRFLKMSEDPAASLKAHDARRDLSRLDQFKGNLDDAQALLDESENALSVINEVGTSALAQVLQGVNGTMAEADRKTIADQLKKFQEMLVGTGNAQVSDRYLFGGMQFENPPFTVKEVGGVDTLHYNGKDLNEAGHTPDAEHRYVDVGIGLSFGAGDTVNQQSALDTAYSGAKLLGHGMETVGGVSMPNNLYNLLGKIADKFESGDLADIAAYREHLENRVADIRGQYVGVGEKTNYVSFFLDRNARSNVTATARRMDAEDLPLEEGAMLFAEQRMMYNACLQMGTKLLQPSLMDFMT